MSVSINGGLVTVTSTAKLQKDIDALDVTSDTATVASKAIWTTYAEAQSLQVVVLKDGAGQAMATVQVERSTGAQFQYDDLKKRVNNDDKYFFCVADTYSISAAAFAGIKDTGCLTGPAKNDGSALSSAPIGIGCSVDQPIKATQTKLLYSPEHAAYASVTPTACLASIEAARPYGYVLPPAAPVSGFSAAPLTGSAPLTVRFSNSSSGNISGYVWNYGDGDTDTDKAPSHTFTAPGSYTVTLTVTGPGGSASAQWPIAVTSPPTLPQGSVEIPPMSPADKNVAPFQNGATATTKQFSITMVQILDPYQSSVQYATKPDPGSRWVAFHVMITSLAASEQSVPGESAFKVKATDNHLYATPFVNPDSAFLHDIDLRQGEITEGNVYFQVPQEAVLAELRFDSGLGTDDLYWRR